ncbi:MAG: YbhB/YbcL family Raf kinase inhibitor-like protein [Pseudorhodoplanes sp.]|jgi:Raf kinase inhibitor-like YbhB/YbcL family protein|nr:YbhB/YbcL family Raf kinase inhibitor-like protein [Pseudorhodoplanes sp.]
MLLSSSAFAARAAIPRDFTCDGEDLSPPLEWSGAPQETRSFVLLCDDPDAPAGTWHHWAAYDIPATQTALLANASAHAGGQGLKQVINDFHRPGYGGPCPPHGHGAHRYHFRLLALSVDHLNLRGHATCRDVAREAHKYVLAEAVLVGTYKR